MKLVIKLLLLFFIVQNSFASDITNTIDTNANPKNSVINASDASDAQIWNLNAQEWSRYQKLMSGPDGHWYPNLTPPEILGLNAQSDSEQRHYAEIVAKELHDKLANELIFDRAVHEAMMRLYADEPVIRPFNLLPFNPIQTSSKTGSAK